MRGFRRKRELRTTNGVLPIYLSANWESTEAIQIARRYLFYCTLNYAFFISDAGQTAHYGIEPKKLSRRELAGIMHGFVNESHKILQQNGLDNNEVIFQNMMTSYFWVIYFGKPVWDKVKKLK